MKIWKEHAGDHSAKLMIIGTFETVENAEKAARVLNKMAEAATGPQTIQGRELFSREVMEVFKEENMPLSQEAIATCQYIDVVKSIGNKIEIFTDDIPAQAVVEVFINCGARIEMYSKHNYKS